MRRPWPAKLLRNAYKDAGRGNPSYLEHLRDVGPRMATAELLVAVNRSGTVLGSVTYVRPGTQYALVSREDEGCSGCSASWSTGTSGSSRSC